MFVFLLMTTIFIVREKELDIRPVGLFPLGIIQALQISNKCFLQLKIVLYYVSIIQYNK